MTITTAAVPVFGDVATIRAHVQFDVEYDDDGLVVGSREWCDARLSEIENYMAGDDAHIGVLEERRAKVEQEAEERMRGIQHEIDEIAGRMDDYEGEHRRMFERMLVSPTQADLLDIWPNPPYGAPLLISLVDEDCEITPPYGAPLVEDLR